MSNQTSMISIHNESQTERSDNVPSLHTRILFASAWIIIAVAGILGNSLVIYVAVRFQKMNNVTNCFIVNLAVTDIVFLSFCMPLLVVQYTFEHWLFDQIYCKLLNFISFVSVLVTVSTLVSMTIDRYIYVVRPFENLKWRKPKNVLFLSIFIWSISCFFASPFYYHYGVTNFHDSQQCVLLSEDDLQNYLRIYIVTLYYFIPLIIIIISYAKLLYFVYSRENKIQQKTKLNVVHWSKKRRAVTKMIAIVTLAFSLCWLPITLYIMSANIFGDRSALLYYFKIIANSFAYLNSAINPILYAFLNRSFRNNCGSLFNQRSCSLIFGENYQQTKVNYQEQIQKQFASTQTDRFSYQSTNHQTETMMQKKIRKKIQNNNRLLPDIISNNDFSDDEEDFKVKEENLALKTQTTAL